MFSHWTMKTEGSWDSLPLGSCHLAWPISQAPPCSPAVTCNPHRLLCSECCGSLAALLEAAAKRQVGNDQLSWYVLLVVSGGCRNAPRPAGYSFLRKAAVRINLTNSCTSLLELPPVSPRPHIWFGLDVPAVQFLNHHLSALELLGRPFLRTMPWLVNKRNAVCLGRHPSPKQRKRALTRQEILVNHKDLELASRLPVGLTQLSAWVFKDY